MATVPTYKGSASTSSGSKSMALGHGGRSAKLKASLKEKGYPGDYADAIVGMIARKKLAAPGQKNYHGR